MEHENLIVVCGHLFRQMPDGDCERPCGVIRVEQGKVTTATCFACTDEINAAADDDVPACVDAFRPLCPDPAYEANIPTEAKLLDGFYEWHGGQWVRQLDDSEGTVN